MAAATGVSRPVATLAVSARRAESSQPSSATMVTSFGRPSLVVWLVRARVSFNMALKIPMRPRGVLPAVWNFSCRILPNAGRSEPGLQVRSLRARRGRPLAETRRRAHPAHTQAVRPAGRPCHNAGRLVEKDTLLKSVWPDVAVEEGNLTKGIFSLRQLLEQEGVRYIETVPKRGYRFAATVTREASMAPARQRRPRQRRLFRPNRHRLCSRTPLPSCRLPT